MRGENIPVPAGPETPPLTPYDPPAPAPQAATRWTYACCPSTAAAARVRSRASRS
jgi:hypothetical protein